MNKFINLSYALILVLFILGVSAQFKTKMPKSQGGNIIGVCTLELEKDKFNTNVYCTNGLAFKAIGRVFLNRKANK